VDTLEYLRFDYAFMRLNGAISGAIPGTTTDAGADGNLLTFGKPNGVGGPGVCDYQTLCIDLPLVVENKSFGSLHLRKDLMHDSISHYTLRRVEHLRRSVVRTLAELERAGGRG
jgi:hypothetical protein